MREVKLALPKAENYLDQIATDAAEEAKKIALDPERLIMLVKHTRQLSSL